MAGTIQDRAEDGTVNYEIVLEDTGEDRRVVHISRLKPCYPTAEEVEEQQRRRLLQLFAEESDAEEFKGFPSTEITLRIPPTAINQSQQEERNQSTCVVEIFQQEMDDEDFLGFTDV